jgi:hypothetical protein
LPAFFIVFAIATIVRPLAVPKVAMVTGDAG